MNRHNRILGILALASLAACARTSMTGMRNPEWSAHSFRRILVFFNSSDLGVRQASENKFLEYAYEANVEFVPASSFFFPGQTYTQEQMNEKLRSEKIDGVILISQGQSGLSKSSTPATATTGCTAWSSNQGCVQTQTTVSGGNTISKPWQEYSVSLVDYTSGKTVWMASASSGGNAFASWQDLRNSLVNKTMTELQKAGILEKRK